MATRFNVEFRTNSYPIQRGLEQYLYELYPEAQASNGGFNYIRAIRPNHPDIDAYRRAAADYLRELNR